MSDVDLAKRYACIPIFIPARLDRLRADLKKVH